MNAPKNKIKKIKLYILGMSVHKLYNWLIKHACIMLLNTGTDPNIKSAINRRDIFPDTSMTFGQFHGISLTALKFPNISRFSDKWLP